MIKQIIIGYISWIWYYLYKPYRLKRQIEAAKRIQICESCKYFLKRSRTCKICGCFMDIKTKMYFKLDENGISLDGCVKGKW